MLSLDTSESAVYFRRMAESAGTDEVTHDNVKLQALVVPRSLEAELRALLVDLRADTPSLMLRVSDAMRHALVRGAAVSREELRQKRAAIAAGTASEGAGGGGGGVQIVTPAATKAPGRRVDTKKLAKKRTTPKRAARH